MTAQLSIHPREGPTATYWWYRDPRCDPAAGWVDLSYGEVTVVLHDQTPGSLRALAAALVKAAEEGEATAPSHYRTGVTKPRKLFVPCCDLCGVMLPEGTETPAVCAACSNPIQPRTRPDAWRSVGIAESINLPEDRPNG